MAGKLGQGVNINTSPNANYLAASDLNGDLQFDTPDSFTIALWLKYRAAFNDVPIIGNSINSTYNPGWVLTEEGGRFEWTAVGGGSVIADPVSGTSPLINDGAWHHLGRRIRSKCRDGGFLRGRRARGNPLPERARNANHRPDVDEWPGPHGRLRHCQLQPRRSGHLAPGVDRLRSDERLQCRAEFRRRFDTYGPFRVYINTVGSNLYVSYQGGTLYRTRWAGPYTPVAGASAPVYVTTASATQKFYKVQ